ncbi:MAG: transporter substrate-binding protein [Paenibacillus sp.]|nr:transporter substrate-binding protein [Paenibacillus sp.]
MKKLGLLALTTIMLATAAVGCGDKPESGTDQGTGSTNGTKTVKIFQFKVEISEQLAKMKEEYEKTHPGVKLQIETVGGGADYGAALKSKFASGETPDIFNNGGFAEADTWMEHLEDLSDQPWVKDTIEIAKAPMTKNGKLYGQPMNIEGYGFVYNKELFEKAGIKELPKTLSQLTELVEKLKAAGITAFANGYQEWWILGIHNMNNAVAKQPNPDQFIKGLSDGTVKFTGNKLFEDWTNLLDLTVKYGNKNPLTTDYNTQVSLFASGQTAIIQQGNWTQVQINKINPNMKLGLMPMPINEDAKLNDNIFVGVPNNWVVNKNSKVKPEAKEFLNWMVSSDIGKRYMTKEFKFIPAFANIEANPADLGDIATEVLRYSKEGKALGWHWPKYPEGATQEFGGSMQKYVAGKATRDQMLAEFQSTWDKLKVKK